MMIATRERVTLRRPIFETHRTEPRLVAQMEASAGGNPKLKPTVFLPSTLPRGQAGLVSK
jgi:hypothetical protein